jgi:peroxiredoxin Q/BCP
VSVSVGKAVPDFRLPVTGAEGATFRLKDARDGKVVLYFYPRDNTPGCTLESQEFQQLLPRFKRAGTRVCGVSRDTLASHAKFCDKFGLAFELLSDEDGKVCELFDVIRDKNMYGKKVRGIERSTFLIDVTGVLRQEWRKVKVPGHAAEVLAAAQALDKAR